MKKKKPPKTVYKSKQGGTWTVSLCGPRGKTYACEYMPEQDADAPTSKQVGGQHYTSLTVQPWEAMESWLTSEQFIGFLRGNAIKYLARCDKKGGVEDIKKALHYLTKLIEVMEDSCEKTSS